MSLMARLGGRSNRKIPFALFKDNAPVDSVQLLAGDSVEFTPVYQYVNDVSSGASVNGAALGTVTGFDGNNETDEAPYDDSRYDFTATGIAIKKPGLYAVTLNYEWYGTTDPTKHYKVSPNAPGVSDAVSDIGIGAGQPYLRQFLDGFFQVLDSADIGIYAGTTAATTPGGNPSLRVALIRP